MSGPGDESILGTRAVLDAAADTLVNNDDEQFAHAAQAADTASKGLASAFESIGGRDGVQGALETIGSQVEALIYAVGAVSVKHGEIQDSLLTARDNTVKAMGHMLTGRQVVENAHAVVAGETMEKSSHQARLDQAGSEAVGSAGAGADGAQTAAGAVQSLENSAGAPREPLISLMNALRGALEEVGRTRTTFNDLDTDTERTMSAVKMARDGIAAARTGSNAYATTIKEVSSEL